MRRFVVSWLATAGLAWSQGVITTVAGTSPFVAPVVNFPAAELPVSVDSDPSLAVDPAGNVYLASRFLCQVFRITPAGLATTVAGNGICGHSGDGGPAVRASISLAGIAVDGQGNLFMIGGNLIRQVAPSGTITTRRLSRSIDLSTQLNPLAVDGAGNFYYAEIVLHRIQRITPDGSVTVYAGNGQPGECTTGSSATAMSISARSLVADRDGTLYVSQRDSAAVCRISPDGSVTRLPAAVRSQGGLAIAANGDLIVAAPFIPLLYRVGADGSPRIIAGIENQQGSTGDGGTAVRATLCPSTVTAAPNDAIYVWDSCGRRLRRIANGIINAFAGTSVLPGNGQPAVTAALGNAFRVAADSLGSIYIGSGERVMRVSPEGILTVVAGNGQSRTAGVETNLDGQRALSVPLNVNDIGVNAQNELLILNSRSQLLRLASGGVLRTVAGDGFGPSRGDGGAAVNARIFQVYSIAVGPDGSIYLADATHRVRRIRPDGVIVNFAGNGTAGAAGDGGQAVAAQLFTPALLEADRFGNVYVAEFGDSTSPTRTYRLRVVSPNGIIQTFALFDYIGALAVDAAGNVYVTDTSRRVVRVGADGTVTPIAGGSNPGGLGDGLLATEARVGIPIDMAFDRQGNLLIFDLEERRVRSVLARAPPFSASNRELRFAADSRGGPPPAQTISLASPIPGLEFTIEPPSGVAWCKLSTRAGQIPRRIEITIDPSQLDPGTYEADLAIRVPRAEPAGATLRITAVIGPRVAPRLNAAQSNLTFSVPRSTPVRTLPLTISNPGGGALDFRISAETQTGGSWLSVNVSGGTVAPGSPVVVTVSANPAGLGPGTYAGTIMAAGTNGEVLNVPVVLTVSRLETAVLLSQTGLSFVAVAGGGNLPPQNFAVLNIGTGRLPWSAFASTLSGGNWLRISATQGVSDASAGEVPSVDVTVDQAGLAVGRFFGQVRVDAPGSANSPQVLTVVLDVVRPEDSPGSILRPPELVFDSVPPSGASAGSLLGSMDVLVYNPSVAPVTFTAVRSEEFTAGNSTLIDVAPLSGVVQPSQPLRMTVQPRTTQSRKGTIDLQFSDGNVRSLAIHLPAVSAARPASGRDVEGCTPTTLVPSLVAIGQGFAVPSGAPAAVVAAIRDDCDQPLAEGGAATLYFSNGDAPVALVPVKNGMWHGTWQARAGAQAQVRVRLDTEDPSRNLKGTVEASTDLRAAADPPLVEDRGIVSAAQPQQYQPLAPNAIISIYGERLADGTAAASSVPIPDRLRTTEVVVGGRRLPLFSVSPTQVNAIVPADLEPNTLHQLLVRRGNVYARPVLLPVAPAQPSAFTVDGIRVIAVAVRGSRQFLVSPSDPASAGDAVVLYCSGLGPTRLSLPTGAVAPGSPLAPTSEPVAVSIGGVRIPVAFAGLTPGSVALYQINLTLPPGLPVGNDVPLVIETLGQSSPPSLLSLR